MLLLLVLAIAVSGACLMFTARGEGGEEGFDETDTDIAEITEISRSSIDTREESDAGGADKIAAMFISSAISDGIDRKSNERSAEEAGIVSSAVTELVGSETSEPVVSDIDGAVFIYHTHSTESYEPYSDGNYHITGSEGTVRNVANELEASLKAKGITVYHDTTLHDSPTYTNSYGRSLQTAKNYLAQHQDIKVMIDLHRDAMSSSGKKYSTVTVNGVTASSFNIVVGKQNDNYPQLMDFAGRVISKANELYPGLGGRIIERDYKFNQYLSDYYLLLEVGNNGNTIDETEATGRLLGDVLEAVMREI